VTAELILSQSVEEKMFNAVWVLLGLVQCCDSALVLGRAGFSLDFGSSILVRLRNASLIMNLTPKLLICWRAAGIWSSGYRLCIGCLHERCRSVHMLQRRSHRLLRSRITL
jgi:hypothetical protein